MWFGPYEDSDFFNLETCAVFASFSPQPKIAEFVCWHKNKIVVVEAKSSTPKYENKADFNSFTSSVSEKLLNGFLLSSAIATKRHSQCHISLPAALQKGVVGGAFVNLILIIRDHKSDWLQPLADAIKKDVKIRCQLIGVSTSAVLVLNDRLALKHGLCQSPP